ncbi:MAG: DNA-processing protein DprA [Alphaproteobacteria bacterium]|nr:DNA-processing protein DprA [Alphaproteobacteria bacterium]
MELSDTEKISCLRLLMTDRIGPITYGHLLDYYGSATESIKHIADMAHWGGSKKKFTIASEKTASEQFDLALKNGVSLIFKQEKAYPKILAEVSDAPPVLFVKGNTTVFNKRGVAIVGTRNASLNGKALARKIAFDLAEAGFQVTSGLAHGIDRAAHVGALASLKLPTTTAVLGTPVNEVYPLENQDIYDEIAEKGCLVSEFPFNSILSPRNFPRRNRIISGLSEATLVIEAQERSGSLITATEAASQGREVMAVPGSPTDPRSAGPNRLIKDGATLISSADDVIEALSNLNHFRLTETSPQKAYQSAPITDSALLDARQKVWDNLSSDPVSVDSIIQETGLSARIVNIILVELSLAGRLERHTGNRVSMIY